jgi:hypothetical protein
MAILCTPHTGTRIMLRTLHAFGRHPSACLTVLQCPEVSHIHALVRWNHQRWEILDQSRNGTFMDGVRLPAGNWLPLAPGNQIALGDSLEAQWSVIDLAAPSNCLFPRHGHAAALELLPHGMFLPSAAQPEVHVHCHEDRWMLEDLRGVTPLDDGATVHTSDSAWEVVLCPDLTRTKNSQLGEQVWDEADIVLRFELSQDEEHAHLHAELGDECVDLGERIHHYTLATLARLRLRDAQRGLDGHSQGWVAMDDLARMLGADPSYINIQIFRARQQLAAALPPGLQAPLLIERRRGEVRLGDYTFTVRRGAALEGGRRRHDAHAALEKAL